MDQKRQELLHAEYIKSCQEWRRRHFFLTAVSPAVLLVAEILMFFIMNRDAIMDSSAQRYFFRYVLQPFFWNACIVLCCWLITRFAKNETAKNYTVSFALLLVAMVITIVHGIFVPVYALLIMPLTCSTLYGDRRLTSWLAAGTVGCLLFSAFGTHYDPSVQRSWEYNYDIALYLLILLCVYAASLFSISWEQRRRMALVERESEMYHLQTLTQRDELTGLNNRLAMRNYFDELLQRDMAGYWFAILDIDHFKVVNDTYGHQVGDWVLKQIAGVLREQSGENLVCFRYGGDEFCLVLYRPDMEAATDTCRGLLRAIRRLAPPTPDAEHCTVSIGLTRCVKGEEISKFFRRADMAMYRAKCVGDCIKVYENLPPEEAAGERKNIGG